MTNGRRMMENKDLDSLIEQAVDREKQLQIKSNELALRDKEFADYLAAKKHADEELEVLWDMVKEYMVENKISEHETDYIKLKLTPSGKYKAEDIDKIDDSLCDIKKILNNRKVKSYLELNGKLPEGVSSTGYLLRKVVK